MGDIKEIIHGVKMVVDQTCKHVGNENKNEYSISLVAGRPNVVVKFSI